MTFKPTKAQILGWRNDPVTIWMFDSLNRQFPPFPTTLPVKDLGEANFKAGQQNYAEALRKLYDFIPKD